MATHLMMCYVVPLLEVLTVEEEKLTTLHGFHGHLVSVANDEDKRNMLLRKRNSL
jgi:hypothetical protein